MSPHPGVVCGTTKRSNIFADEGATNGTHRPVFRQPRMRRDPVTGVGVQCWDLHAPRCAPSKWKADSSSSSTSSSCPSSGTPEARTPEQAPQPQPPQQQQQQQHRQRVPPGGFSTRLW
ncbi:uncharacterized protein LOC135113225 isoform X1 [Scylla paramamosain]|uniref:uncharacterized protein LOC135113225 isoform X1 n=1 Tax=Scylla paramamosain TaxID=85552 RepID=UPI003082F588